MDLILEIVKILLPSAAVFAAAYLIVQRFLESEQKRREIELRKGTQNMVTPLKLQAYERLVIFLERLNPNSLVVRVNKNGLTSHQLHMELIKAIKTEYEHNLSQQIYMSSSAWELIKNAKEEITKLVNLSSTKVAHDASSNDLAMMILNVVANMGKKLPSEIALDYLKKEVSRNF
jgi:hypothetical protein